MNLISKPEFGYFLEMDTKNPEKLLFQYNPETIEETNGAKWIEINIPGITHPKLQYTGGTGRDVNFSLKFFALDEKDKKMPAQKVAWLRSLLFPNTQTSNLIRRAPRRVLFGFGQMYKGIPFVVTEVNVQYSKLWTPKLEPLYVEVSIKLKEARVTPVSYQNVRQGRA